MKGQLNEQLNKVFNDHIENFNKDVVILTENIFNYIKTIPKDEFVNEMCINIKVVDDGECIMFGTSIFSKGIAVSPEYTQKVLTKAIENFENCDFLTFEETPNGFKLTTSALYE